MNIQIDHQRFSTAAEVVASKRRLDALFRRVQKKPVVVQAPPVAASEPVAQDRPFWQVEVNVFDSHVQVYRTRRVKMVSRYIAMRAAQEGFSYDDIIGPGRFKEAAMLRQLLVWEVKQRAAAITYPMLGRAFGGRDHTTMTYSVRKIDGMIADGLLEPWGWISEENLKASMHVIA